jgi:hypothetical protein
LNSSFSLQFLVSNLASAPGGSWSISQQHKDLAVGGKLNRQHSKPEIMNDKKTFNLIFAILAFPIGLALFREFDFQTFTFKKTALGILYLITFIFLIYLTFKKNKKQPEK